MERTIQGHDPAAAPGGHPLPKQERFKRRIDCGPAPLPPAAPAPARGGGSQGAPGEGA